MREIKFRVWVLYCDAGCSPMVFKTRKLAELKRNRTECDRMEIETCEVKESV
jgi:hypothetical protein